MVFCVLYISCPIFHKELVLIITYNVTSYQCENVCIPRYNMRARHHAIKCMAPSLTWLFVKVHFYYKQISFFVSQNLLMTKMYSELERRETKSTSSPWPRRVHKKVVLVVKVLWHQPHYGCCHIRLLPCSV